MTSGRILTGKLIGLVPRRGSRFWSAGRMMLLAGAVGLAAGAAAVAFQYLCNAVAFGALELAAGYSEADPASVTIRPWALAIIPAVGGLVAGVLIYRIAPQAAGPGTGAAIGAYHHGGGRIAGRVGVVKILASAITLGTGGSGGREGPIALAGASFGSYIGEKFRLSARERRMLLVAGMGAGIGAFFRAPLAGAIFAVEVLYSDPDFESAGLIPAFFATTAAYCVFTAVSGVDPVLPMQAMARMSRPVLLLPLTAMTLVAVLAALAYVVCLRGSQALFERLPLPNYVKPCIGALGAGLVAVGIYYSVASLGSAAQLSSLSVLGHGTGFVRELLNGSGGVRTLVVLLVVVALGKIVTTSLTIGSGGSGGVFGPSLLIGGSVGAVVGLVCQYLMPSLVTRVDVFVILGAAAFFTAATNTPVSTLIMVSEMTGSYAMLLPSMWVCGLAYLLSRGWSLYGQQVASRAESPAHRGEMIVDVLADETVADVWGGPDERMITVPKETLMSQMAIWVAATRQRCFPVVDDDGLMCGYLSLEDIRYFLFDSVAGEMITAEALAAKDVEPLTLRTDLTAAMGRFSQTSYAELPVVESDNPRLVLGLLSRQDVVARYHARLGEGRPETQ